MTILNIPHLHHQPSCTFSNFLLSVVLYTYHKSLIQVTLFHHPEAPTIKHFLNPSHTHNMFAKVLTVLSAASLVAATPLVPRQASGSAVASTSASVDVFSTELCVYAYGTASRKGGPRTTTVTEKPKKVTVTQTSTYTPSTTTTPHYISTVDYTVSKPITKTTTVTVTPSAYVVPAAQLQLPINSTELTPSKNKRQVAVQEAPYSNSTTSATYNSTEPATASLPNGGVITVSGPTPSGPATLYSCQVAETTTYYTTKVSTAKKTTTYTAVPVATSTKSIDVGTTRPIVTSTSTVVAATPTVYAACQPGWIVDEVDGYPVEGFANVGGVTHTVPAADCAYDVSSPFISPIAAY